METTGGDDYREINADFFDVFLTFNDATRRQSFRVEIFDDNLQESEETFDMELRFDPVLEMPPEGVTLFPNVSTVIIEENDGTVSCIIQGYKHSIHNN